MNPQSHIKCGGVIIAGGRAARMGGAEKPFLKLSGRPIIERLVERVRPQVDALAIDVREASRDRYQAWRAIGISILSDPFRGEAGPLGGIIGGLRWLETLGSDFEWLATFPGDTPLLPRDLVTRMRASAREGARNPVVAVDGGGVQSLCALWPRSCLTGLTGMSWKRASEAFEPRCNCSTQFRANFSRNTRSQTSTPKAISLMPNSSCRWNPVSASAIQSK